MVVSWLRVGAQAPCSRASDRSWQIARGWCRVVVRVGIVELRSEGLFELRARAPRTRSPHTPDPSRGPKLLYPDQRPPIVVVRRLDLQRGRAAARGPSGIGTSASGHHRPAGTVEGRPHRHRARHLEGIDALEVVGVLDRAVDRHGLVGRIGGAAERAAQGEGHCRARSAKRWQLSCAAYHQKVPINEKTLRSGLIVKVGAGGYPASMGTPLP